jgi:two-component system cell cycle response regulator DivK
VEDEPNNMMLMNIVLKKHGHEAAEAYTGKEAIEKAVSFQPDVILMDIKLPDMDGFETTRKIKEIEKIKRVPVIVVTSYAKEDHNEEAKNAGCCGFLQKPINPRTIIDEIKGIMALS